MPAKTAFVTGANKGIGFEVARQLAASGIKVFLGARDPEKGRAAVEKLRHHNLDAEFVQVDVSSEASITAAVAHIAQRTPSLDILVNNAGIYSDEGMEFESRVIRESFETNALGPLLVTRACMPLLKKAAPSQVVNVSTGMSATADRREGAIAYRISKTALNAITRIVSNELYDDKIWVNAACPGWVRTDMGGANATRDVVKGAETIVWLATGGAGKATGNFYRDQKQIDW
jgi:NAD(P)-dependent dehydrogenase (short-subunit alcohol dehydrogenase family)